jgi:hypothetical protein
MPTSETPMHRAAHFGCPTAKITENEYVHVFLKDTWLALRSQTDNFTHPQFATQRYIFNMRFKEKADLKTNFYTKSGLAGAKQRNVPAIQPSWLRYINKIRSVHRKYKRLHAERDLEGANDPTRAEPATTL